jgi:hypothetical protein
MNAVMYKHGMAAFLLLVMTWGTPATAHLGDSREQSVKHPGEGQVVEAVAPATHTLKHVEGAVEVTADFIGDTTERITFVKKGVFDASEIAELLAANAQGKAWKPQSNALNPVAEKLGMQRWLRSDRGSAELSVSDGVSRMVITTPVWTLQKLRSYMGSKFIVPPAHKLTWQDYDGTGDAAKAKYVLDDQVLGVGEAGLTALRKAMSEMPKGAKVLVVPYYGDPGGEKKRSYPFKMEELKAAAEDVGVTLSTASAK